MRDLVAICSIAFALIFCWAEYRGVPLIPRANITDVAPGVHVPGDGIRILFVRPSDPAARLPDGHENLPAMGVIRDWIRTNNATFRNWPSGADDSAAPDAFRVMMTEVQRSEPYWLVVANGSKVRYSGPWPKTADEAIQILESCQ